MTNTPPTTDRQGSTVHQTNRRIRWTVALAAACGASLAPPALAADVTNPAQNPDPIEITIDGQKYTDGEDTLPGYDDQACTPIPGVQYDFAANEIQYYDGGELIATAKWTEWQRISSYETWKQQQQQQPAPSSGSGSGSGGGSGEAPSPAAGPDPGAGAPVTGGGTETAGTPSAPGSPSPGTSNPGTSSPGGGGGSAGGGWQPGAGSPSGSSGGPDSDPGSSPGPGGTTTAPGSTAPGSVPGVVSGGSGEADSAGGAAAKGGGKGPGGPKATAEGATARAGTPAAVAAGGTPQAEGIEFVPTDEAGAPVRPSTRAAGIGILLVLAGGGLCLVAFGFVRRSSGSLPWRRAGLRPTEA